MSMRDELLLLTAMFGGMPYGGHRRYIDVKEYNLIQQKKSKLIRSKRDQIVYDIEQAIKKGALVRLEDGTVDYKIEIL